MIPAAAIVLFILFGLGCVALFTIWRRERQEPPPPQQRQAETAILELAVPISPLAAPHPRILSPGERIIQLGP